MIKFIRYIVLLISLQMCPQALSAETASENVSEVQSEKVKNITVKLVYDQKSLSEILNEISKLKQINLLIPQDVNLSNKVSINYGIVSLSQAWNYVISLLNSMGYTIIEKNNTHIITATKKIALEPLPLFVNIDPESLPNSQEIGRYLYYFNNVNIADKNSTLLKQQLDTLLKDVLSLNSGDDIVFDLNSNSVTLVAQISILKHVVGILKTVDNSGFQENIAIIPIEHSNAIQVANILNKLVPGQEPQQQAYVPNANQPKLGYYFPENTKISHIARSNSIVILGNKESIARVKEFIKKYLDVPTDSGYSVIHVKTLQFLDAAELAQTFSKMLSGAGSSSQSTGQQLQDTLSRVIITAAPKAAAPYTSNQNGTTSVVQPITLGSNNIYVAATKDDWEFIEKIIDELDVPQLQVAIEALIVELTINDHKLIGAQTRNPVAGLPPEFKWQSAQLVQPWLNFIPPGDASNATINTARGLAADLLQMTNQLIKNVSGSTNMAKLAQAGTTVISFNDGQGIAGVLEVLDASGNNSILSQPFLITKNNATAETKAESSRLVPGSIQQQSSGGPVNIPNDDIAATLQLKITPRISRSNNINLTVAITVNSFVDPNPANTNNTQTVREIITNANVGNNEVLVIGGLTKDRAQEDSQGWPILSSIPIIGYLFKRRAQEREKTTLMVFIQPRIIQPRLGGGINKFTRKKLDFAKNAKFYADSGLEGVPFDKIKDPVTKFFFSSNTEQ